MIDLNHGSGYVYGRGVVSALAVTTVSDLVNQHIDSGLQQKERKAPKRNYLGASRLGDPCDRKLYYEYRHEHDSEFSGRQLRIFAAGHRFEDMMIDWLKAGGFDLKIRNKHGEQFGFSVLDGRIQGHFDGVIVAGPDLGEPYPLLWECKGLNDKSWKHLAAHGLRKSKEVYFGQTQLYMGYRDLAACLFTALNKNTCEIYHELVKYDSAEAQRLSDRGLRIVQAGDAGELPPRISNDPDCFACRFCERRGPCWSGK